MSTSLPTGAARSLTEPPGGVMIASDTKEAGMIVAVTEDLILRARLEEAAPRGQLKVTANLVEAGRLAAEASLLLVDLEYGAAEVGVLLSSIRRLPSHPYTIGWVTHARWKETAPLHGLCDRVVSRRDFVVELPALLSPDKRAT